MIFMKKFFLLLIFLSISFFSYSQTYIKGNATYALFAIPSFGIEVGIGEKTTFQLDATMSFWNSITLGSKPNFQKRPFVFNYVFPEFRYYFKEKNDGFYLGAHTGAGMFKLSKNKSYASRNMYQYGYIFFTGITAGYQWKLKERWSLDLFLSGGWSNANYQGFDRDTGERVDDDCHELGLCPTNIRKGYNYSAQWIPYRGGLMIGYKLN